jgi:hypothetical protein
MANPASPSADRDVRATADREVGATLESARRGLVATRVRRAGGLLCSGLASEMALEQLAGKALAVLGQYH